MVYTGRGDKGKTDLMSGERVEKSNPRIEAYGAVDELNSLLGVIDSKFEDVERIHTIQNELHVLQAELADKDHSGPKITDEDVQRLEDRCDHFQNELPPMDQFVIPGGSEPASYLHHARAVCRRAERKVSALRNEKYLRPESLTYINRLSDLLFLKARFANHRRDHDEKHPTY